MSNDKLVEKFRPFCFGHYIKTQQDNATACATIAQEYAKEVCAEKDKEVERLKGLIELAFQFTPRLDTQWQQFKLDNNL